MGVLRVKKIILAYFDDSIDVWHVYSSCIIIAARFEITSCHLHKYVA